MNEKQKLNKIEEILQDYPEWRSHMEYCGYGEEGCEGLDNMMIKLLDVMNLNHLAKGE